jgi:LPS O-antigen subunit length determinant protein (WzzB/FepE family)
MTIQTPPVRGERTVMASSPIRTKRTDLLPAPPVVDRRIPHKGLHLAIALIIGAVMWALIILAAPVVFDSVVSLFR